MSFHSPFRIAVRAVPIDVVCETRREQRVILLGVCTGARSSELIGFQGRHFAREGLVWFSADIAKGKRERWVPVLPELAAVAQDIRANVCHDHYVITTYRAGGLVACPPTVPIARTALARIVRGVADRAGLTGHVYPHLLRHAFGDHVAKHAGLRVAQALMGHSSVQTTASVYVERPGLDELAASVEGLTYGERRARFGMQMQNSFSQTLDRGGRATVRWVLAR